MKIVSEISEDEMVACFLIAESNSKRFNDHLNNAAKMHDVDYTIIQKPNLNNKSENQLRRKILETYRGYNNALLFEGFPPSVKWARVDLTPSEVLKIKYADYSYWNELSKGRRSPISAVETIKEGREIFGTRNTNFIEAADSLKKGVKFPELILVSTSPTDDLVALEGHLRLTAYALAREFIPDPLQVIVGFSEQMKGWSMY